MPEPDDPMTRLRTETRTAQILRAAAEAFAEQGFHRTTVRDVAQRAGLAEGTIYTYFGSKQDLLLGLLDAVNETEDRPAAFADAAAADVGDFLRSYLKHRLEALAPHLDVLRPILSELLVDADLRATYREATLEPTLALAEGYLRTKAERGEIGPFAPEFLARALAAQVLGLALLRMLGDTRLEDDWRGLHAPLTELLQHGLEGGRSA